MYQSLLPYKFTTLTLTFFTHLPLNLPAYLPVPTLPARLAARFSPFLPNMEPHSDRLWLVRAVETSQGLFWFKLNSNLHSSIVIHSIPICWVDTKLRIEYRLLRRETTRRQPSPTKIMIYLGQHESQPTWHPRRAIPTREKLRYLAKRSHIPGAKFLAATPDGTPPHH
jgi:hypothetical protein